MVKLARAVYAGTALALLWGFAGAQQPSAERVEFSIASSLLPNALTLWAQQAGMQLIWPSDERASEFKVSPIVGFLTAESALQRLLEGSGLTYSFVDARTVAIRRAMPAVPDGNSGKNGTGPAKVAGPAAGPNAAGPQPLRVPPQTEEIALKEVIVTGSHIRGGNPAAPIFSIERGAMERTGYATLPQLVQSFPQNFNDISDATFGTLNGGANSSVGNGWALNLRGLGSVSTLVLLNGRRMAPAGDGSFVDVSLIPWAAIERVDVLTDGASAIYGSDAIGGVVNVILRNRFDGAETQLRYGTATRGDAGEYRLGQTFGRAWDDGVAALSYEYLRREALDASDRDFTSGVPGSLDLLPRQERHGIVATFSQRVTPRAEFFSDVFFSGRSSDQGYTILGPVSRQSASVDQVHGALGMQLDLPDGWEMAIAGTYGSNDTRQQSFANGSPSSLFKYSSRTSSMDVSGDGPVARSFGGRMSLALGAQLRHERFDPEALVGLHAGDSLARDVGVFYGELLVPLVNSENRRPGVERLELTAAGRLEHYSDFGTTTNPKFGVSWSPWTGLNVRGTYGTSFRAPLLSQINPATTIPVAFDLADPGAPNGVTSTIVLFGSREGLDPERATTWSAGVDVVPAGAYGFAASLTYFGVRFEDRVATPVPDDGRLSMAFESPEYDTFVDRTPDAALLAALFQHPNFLNVSSATSATQIGAVLDDRLVNLVEQRLSGVDALFSYRDKSSFGEFSVQLAGSYLFDGRKRARSTDAWTDTLDSVFNPVDLRLRGSLSLTRGAATASAFVNYTDGYQDKRSYTVAEVGSTAPVASWTTVDLTLNYEGGDAGADWLRGAGVGLSIINVLDRDPPYIASPLNLHFDGANASPLGRTIGVMIRKRW